MMMMMMMMTTIIDANNKDEQINGMNETKGKKERKSN